MRIQEQSPADRPGPPRGTVAPILALVMVTMVGFLSLSIDVGMLAVAKTQAQQAADLATLTAARTVNGDTTTGYNQTAATTNAKNALSYNVILAKTVTPSQLQLTYGSYDYNQSTQTFNANFPPTPGMPISAVAATITTNGLPAAFGAVMGTQFLPNVTAASQSVHRPRDIALVMDLSGSMRFGTCLGFDYYTSTRTTNNPDPLVPTFGHYSSNSAVMQGPSTNRASGSANYTISPSNTTAPTSSYSLTYVNNFYQNDAYASTLIRAFDSYTSTDLGVTWTAPTSGTPVLPPASYASVPGGDVPLFKSASTTTYATTVKDVVGSATVNALWELDGYSGYKAGQPDTTGAGGYPKVWAQPDYSDPACQFLGYTQGPGYYGKTFFMWPPDPRNGAISNVTTLKSFLTLIGLTNASAQTSLASNWATWLGQGATGQTNLQNWLSTAPVSMGGPYTAAGPYVPGSSNQAPTSYAVLRLFNRGYPAGLANGAYVADWRSRFFGTTTNTTLFNSSGSLNVPGGSTYAINYNAILAWIAQTPNPFPAQMRAGRIKYYGAIPAAITGSWPSYGSTDQRFWVECIDYMLGFRQTSAGSYQDVSAMAGYGQDFTWGTLARNSVPGGAQYMNYLDNPARPLARYWFGPMALVDYMQNYNINNNISNCFFMQPGDSYEAPLYNGKQAFVAAVETMELNHPNDWVSVVPYSWPRTTSTDSNGRFNVVRSPLGTNYDYATASLIFPFSTLNANGTANSTEITPYAADPATGQVPSADFKDVPRADGNTCFSMALMLCYNQFAVTPVSDGTLRNYVTSSPINFPTGMAGGMGRKGAQKVVIFETDGLPNTTATATLTKTSTYGYYRVRYNMNNPSGSEYPSIGSTNLNDPTVVNQINSLVQQLATDYGTTRNPFRLYAVGFGPVFQGSLASSALSTLQGMQFNAGTQASASTPLPANQVIIGTGAQMSASMIKTFTNILQNGVQIALVK